MGENGLYDRDTDVEFMDNLNEGMQNLALAAAVNGQAILSFNMKANIERPVASFFQQMHENATQQNTKSV